MPLNTTRTYPSDAKYRDLLGGEDSKAELDRKTIRSGGSVMAANIVSSIVRIGSTAILARLLLPQDFGLLSMVTAITVIAERFQDLGLSDATIQNKNINHTQISGLFWLNVGICCGIGALVAAFSKTIARFYGEPRLTGISLVIASTFALSGLVIQHQALLRRRLRLGTLAAIQLSSMIFSLLVAVVLAYYKLGYWALVGKELSRAVFVFVATWIVCPWRPGLPHRQSGLAPLLSFGWKVTGFNLAYFISRSIDRVFVGKFSGATSLGFYDNAFKLVSIPGSPVRDPVVAVALPVFSALQEKPNDFRAYYNRMSGLLTFCVPPLVLLFVLFADVIVELMLGPKWTGVVPIFRVLAVGAFSEPAAQLVGSVLMANGKPKEYLWLGIVGAVLFVVSVVVAGILWGAIGVAIGNSVASVISCVLFLFVGLRHTPIVVASLVPRLAVDYLCAIVWGSVICAVRYAFGWLIRPHWFFVFAILGAAAYVGLWLLIPGGRRRVLDYFEYARRVMVARKK
jgi:O-antigen/teichoic acid export membrane protein